MYMCMYRFVLFFLVLLVSCCCFFLFESLVPGVSSASRITTKTQNYEAEAELRLLCCGDDAGGGEKCVIRENENTIQRKGETKHLVCDSGNTFRCERMQRLEWYVSIRSLSL